MQRRFIRRRTFRALAAAAAASAACLAIAADATTRHAVKDPNYGDTLFHFYQDHYFSSLTSLMVSQHFNRVSHHADEAELLRAGLLLSYGLHRQAGEIFAQVIDNSAAPSVRDRAWYFLAKIRYQRGFYAEAEEAIARIGRSLPPELEAERALLSANLLMARGDYAAAARVLSAMDNASAIGRYVRYNLGVALVKNGDLARGTALLDELGRAPAANEEQRSLRDKANVALGFAALQQSHPQNARTFLERVRMSGLDSNKALLGFGWAAATMKQPKQALVPWSELMRRDAGDAAVLEARLAVPYAYAELGAYGQALQGYSDALTSYEREDVALDASISAIRSGKLVSDLLQSNPADEMGWFWNIRQLPRIPHAGHLRQLLAQHAFQEAFKNYRDLQYLSKNLLGWTENLVVFGDVLSHRRLAYSERLPQVRAKASEGKLAELAVRGALLAGELTRAEAESDASAFADAKERELQARLDSARATLKQVGAEPEFERARERLRLAAGALTWRQAQAYPVRLWEARKALRATDHALTQARGHEAALAQAQRDEPARFERFAARIAELDGRIKQLMPQVAALSREQQGYLEDLAVAELTLQKQRLAEYAAQARLAVAQLYDRASVAKKADDEIKP